jgi:TonB family protein
MNEIVLYLTKSLLTGMLFFGFYHFFMRKETYLSLNRYYLLATAILMAILPLLGSILPLNLSLPGSEKPLPLITLPVVEITGERIITTEQQKAILDWAMISYLVVTLAMLGGLLFSIYRIIRFYRSAIKAEKMDKNIFLINDGKSPFSFLGRIFIPRHYADHPQLSNILIHENAHINQKHLLDLVILELLSSVFWFNPFFFLVKRAMREVHEYLADREVIRQGIETLTYQQLLFNEVSGNPQYIIANNFNLLTKKRIVMLIKKSGQLAAVRIGALLPFIIAAGLAVAMIQVQSLSAQNEAPPIPPQSATVIPAPPALPEVAAVPEPPAPPVVVEPVAITQEPQKPEKKSAKNENENEVFTVVEDPPQFPGGQDALTKYMISSIKYPDEARKAGIQGTVYVTYVVEPDGSITNVKVLRGIDKSCDVEAARVIREMPKWKPGKQRGKAVRVQFNMPIKFTLDDSKSKEKAK